MRERLRARLGDDAVGTLQVQADHRPECAWYSGEGRSADVSLPAAPRPGWLLAEPQALLPEGLQVLAGPERIESGWWDGDDIRRDYYLIETASGQRGWAYRNVGDSRALWLQGWFA